MTLKEWLQYNDVRVERYPRGFNITNASGEARYVKVVERLTRHVGDDDVCEWIDNHLTFFDDIAVTTWDKVIRPC